MNFVIQENILILKNKDNGYHRIILFCPGLEVSKPFLVQYIDGEYSSYKQYKSLKDTFEKFKNYDVSPITGE